MKKSYLLIGMLSSALAGKAQMPDSSFQKKIIPETDVQLLFSYYGQDGNNSAVTGGIGTEKLSVYAPDLSVTHQKANHTIDFDGGADVITSASVDNIDFVMSSPSRTDTRWHAQAGYSHAFRNNNLEVGARTGFSIESDYFSVPIILNSQYNTPDQRQSFVLGFEFYDDDLRWGRLNPDYYRPVKLIYPVELRYKEWYDEYKRYTYNLKPGFSHVINQRMMAGIFSALSYQHGLLATPFHRVYFNNDSERVENLPDDRFKIPIEAKLNYFLGARTILKGSYTFYWDSWGILSNALQVEAAFKINPRITLSPAIRIYHQSAARYFAPYKQHDTTEQFYTSDYDLSKLNSFKLAAEFQYTPLSYGARRLFFNEMDLRYSAYFQSTKLHAMSVTALLDMNFKGKEKERMSDNDEEKIF